VVLAQEPEPARAGMDRRSRFPLRSPPASPFKGSFEFALRLLGAAFDVEVLGLGIELVIGPASRPQWCANHRSLQLYAIRLESSNRLAPA
jgi:hypothetical protein